jgi:small GTP-binding protein
VLKTRPKKLLINKIKKKILLIGEGGIGKTSLLYRYINNNFLVQTKMTIGSNIFVKTVRAIHENQENHLTMLIWDYAGQKRFRMMLREFSKGTHLVILAFDLVRIQTLVKLKDWINLMKSFGLWGNNQVDFYLVGMKKDLLDSPYMTSIPQKKIKDFQKKYSIMKYKETSSAHNEGIHELFSDISISLIEQLKK